MGKPVIVPFGRLKPKIVGYLCPTMSVQILNERLCTFFIASEKVLTMLEQERIRNGLGSLSHLVKHRTLANIQRSHTI